MDTQGLDYGSESRHNCVRGKTVDVEGRGEKEEINSFCHLPLIETLTCTSPTSLRSRQGEKEPGVRSVLIIWKSGNTPKWSETCMSNPHCVVILDEFSAGESFLVDETINTNIRYSRWFRLLA